VFQKDLLKNLFLECPSWDRSHGHAEYGQCVEDPRGRGYYCNDGSEAPYLNFN
jgi:hypothetical protein